MIVEVAETPDLVRIAFSRAKLSISDEPRIQRFLWPIIASFESDPRPMSFIGEHADYEGIVEVRNGVARATIIPDSMRRAH